MNILEEIPNSKTGTTPSLPTKKSVQSMPSSSASSSSSSSVFSSSRTNGSRSSKKSSVSSALFGRVDTPPADTPGNSLIAFDFRTFIIIILVLLIILAYYGFNILALFGDAVQKGVDVLTPTFSQFLELVGYSSGTAINKAAEITSDVTTGGIELAEGAVQNVGNIMIGDKAVGHKKYGAPADPEPDTPEDSIQKSLSASKTKWCLVGEYKNKRGCIDISESDKCLSGQVFPNEEMCLNPTQTPSRQ